jgi:predicted acylesterase/phospholipase RssA
MILKRKLRFFLEMRHSLGRSALLLSGGITLGMYHLGVVKALHTNGLLPRVISGSSAGSIVAAIVGSTTDDEMPDIFAGTLALLCKHTIPRGVARRWG